MRSVTGCAREGKKTRVSGEAAVLSPEELDAKAELIKALIPLGPMAVSQTLEAEATELAGERYRRDGGRPGLARYGSNRPSVRLAGDRVPLRVPCVRNVAEGKEVPLASLQALRAAIRVLRPSRETVRSTTGRGAARTPAARRRRDRAQQR